MNILLINNNPVVSRLLALCTRDEHMVLEEVEGVETIQHEHYDVVFVDEGSHAGEVLNISDILNIGKKIFLSNNDIGRNDFDMTVQKPFLPSQIIELLDTIEVTDDFVSERKEEEVPSIFPLSTETEEKVDDSSKKEVIEELKTSKTQVLDVEELEKIKALLDMDDEIEEIEENLSDKEIEIRKVEAIKKQLIADGLEIVEEEELVEGISLNDEVIIFSNREKSKNKVKKKKSSKNRDKKSKKKKKKSMAFTEEELEHIEDAVQVAIATLKRKQMKKLLKGKEIEISIKLEDKH